MYEFETVTGKITIDYSNCENCKEKPCVGSCIPQILSLVDGKPVLCIEAKEAAAGRCIECLACELACEFHGNKGLHIHLPLPEIRIAER